MKRSISFIFLAALVLAHLAAADPKPDAGTLQKAPDSKAAMKKSVAAAQTPQAFISGKIVNFFKPKTGAQLMAEKAKDASPAVKQAPPAAPEKAAPVKPGYVPPPPPAAPTPQVNQIRQEVQKILDLNKKIKNIQGDRVIQMQRIQEQARIHKKILDQLEAGKNAQKGQKLPDKEALFAQEKLRIIHEETRRNHAAMTDATAPKPQPVKVVPVKQDQAPAKT